MTAAQTLGRLGVADVTTHLVSALDDSHSRVRSAALVALGRVGDATALGRLAEAAASDPGNRQVEAAVGKVVGRL